MPHQRTRNSIPCPSRALRPHHHRFAVRFAYDGSDYHGFQSQLSSTSTSTSTSSISDSNSTDAVNTNTNTNTNNTVNTIQDQIELRLCNLLKRPVRILGWGRTDAGVHASGAVFTVDLSGREVMRIAGLHTRRNRTKKSNGDGTMKKSPSERNSHSNGNGNCNSNETMEAEDVEDKDDEGIRIPKVKLSKKEKTKQRKKLAKLKLKEMNNNEKQKHRKPQTQTQPQQTVPFSSPSPFKEHDNHALVSVSDSMLQSAASTLLSTLRLFSHRPGSITAHSVTPLSLSTFLRTSTHHRHHDDAIHSFDARFSCQWKRYVYYISHGCGGGGSLNPFVARYAWQIDPPLNMNANSDPTKGECGNANASDSSMMQAVALLNGRHNFEWLSVVEPGEVRDPIRTLTLSVEEIATGSSSMFSMHNSGSGSGSRMIKVSATCDFFLYRMVRRIVGVLVAVGTGRVEASVLESCIRVHDAAVGIGRIGRGTDGAVSGSVDIDTDAGRDDVPFSVLDTISQSNPFSNKKEEKNAYMISEGLLQTAPAHGLCLEHVEYDIPI